MLVTYVISVDNIVGDIRCKIVGDGVGEKVQTMVPDY